MNEVIKNEANNNEVTLFMSSSEQTQQWGEALARFFQGGEMICLIGDLGAGKTTLTQGFARGLNIQRTVNSPTYTILKVYEQGRLPFYHIDAYRLEDEMEMLGLEEYIHSDGVCVIEWPERIAGQLPQQKLQIELTHVDEQTRKLHVRAIGQTYERLLQEVNR